MPYFLEWRDYFIIDDQPLPITSGNITENRSIIKADAINGYGGDPHAQKAFEINYQRGIKDYSGNLACALFCGSGPVADVCKKLIFHTIDPVQRRQNLFVGHYGGQIAMPDANGKCLVSSLTLNYNASQIVTMTANFKATGKSDSVPDATHYTFEPATPYEGDATADNMNPMPWYRVGFDINGAASARLKSDNITQLTLNIDNATQVEYTFNGTGNPFRVSQGTMRVTGSLTYLVDVGTDKGLAGYPPFEMILDFDKFKLTMPHVYVENDPASMAGASRFLTRTVSFTCFAGDDYSPSIGVE